MTRTAPFEAVISDMDGVLTRTATLHERAWKLMFEQYLGTRREQDTSFSSSDYRAFVDGKPRYDGVRDFLASRSIELEPGDPADDSSADTLCGLGNRKNELFLALLEREGIHVFEDAVAALDRWQLGGLRVAVVSASRNCCRILDAADLTRRVDAIVGGELTAELGLAGKREIMLEASRRLGIDPADAVVLEDATAGVRAARQAGFGFVIGVSRNEHGQSLLEAGAHEVVRTLSRARFPRRIPSALERRAELARRQGDRALATFLDFDGTLAPIVDHPADARLPERLHPVLETLAGQCPVAIVSGRDRADVEARVAIDGLIYAGNHGFDIAGRGREKTLPEAAEALGDVALAEEELRRHLGRLSGVVIERKRFSVAVHYRMVGADSVVAQVAKTVEEVQARTSLRKRIGKKVLELEPAVEWDKGRAVRWLLDALSIEPERYLPIYVGDDETDEDAFASLAGRGIGVRVGREVSTTLADYRVADTDEVRVLLEWLATRCASGREAQPQP